MEVGEPTQRLRGVRVAVDHLVHIARVEGVEHEDDDVGLGRDLGEALLGGDGAGDVGRLVREEHGEARALGGHEDDGREHGDDARGNGAEHRDEREHGEDGQPHGAGGGHLLAEPLPGHGRAVREGKALVEGYLLHEGADAHRRDEGKQDVEGPAAHDREREGCSHADGEGHDKEWQPHVGDVEDEAARARDDDLERRHHNEGEREGEAGDKGEGEALAPGERAVVADALGEALNLGLGSGGLEDADAGVGVGGKLLDGGLGDLAGVLVDAEGPEQPAPGPPPHHAEHRRERHGHARQRLDGVGHDRGVHVGGGRRGHGEPGGSHEGRTAECVEYSKYYAYGHIALLSWCFASVPVGACRMGQVQEKLKVARIG